MPRQGFGLSSLCSSFLGRCGPRVQLQWQGMPWGHLGTRSGLSFLQHGHNSYQPHLGALLLFSISLCS